MTLQILQEEDLQTVLQWRNHKSIRMNMRNNHVITYEEHRAWFDRIRQEKSSLWYVYADSLGNKRGVTYFTDYDEDARNSFFGLYSSPGSPPGTGAKIEFVALEHAFNVLNLQKLFCNVFVFNRNVLQMHLKFGFSIEKEFNNYIFDKDRNCNVVRLCMSSDTWNANRLFFSKYFEKLKTL